MSQTRNAKPKPTAFEAVEAELRKRIIEGTLPAGTRLNVDELRREFGVSTSTVREALSRMLSYALVVSRPKIGFSVAPLSVEDCIAVARIRELIEVEALRDSLANRTAEWEGDLAGAYHLLSRADERFIIQGDIGAQADWQKRNKQFHDALVSTCTNSYIMSFRRSINFHSDRYRALMPRLTQSASNVPEEHRQLCRSALDGRVEDCVEVLRNHILTTVKLVVEHLKAG